MPRLSHAHREILTSLLDLPLRPNRVKRPIPRKRRSFMAKTREYLSYIVKLGGLLEMRGLARRNLWRKRNRQTATLLNWQITACWQDCAGAGPNSPTLRSWPIAPRTTDATSTLVETSLQSIAVATRWSVAEPVPKLHQLSINGRFTWGKSVPANNARPNTTALQFLAPLTAAVYSKSFQSALFGP